MSQATQKATIAAAVLALAAVVAYMRRKRLLTTISSDGHACTQVPEAPNVHQMATSPKASPSSTSQPTQDATIAAATQSCEAQSTEAEAPTRRRKGTEATALAAPDEPRQEAERTALSASNNSEKGKEPKAIAAPGKPPQEEKEKTALAAQGTAKDETEATALAARVEDVLAKLRPTEAGSEARRVQALDLLSALRAATDLRSSKLQRRVARAFVDNEGPELVYAMESSMRGNWMADAKNGTMRTLTAVSQLSGPIGKAMATYRAVAEKNLVDAAHGVGCEHTGAQPTAVAPRRGDGHP